MPFPKHHDDGKIHCFNTCPESEKIPNGQPYTSRKNCLPSFGFRILVCLKNREMKGSSKSTMGNKWSQFLESWLATSVDCLVGGDSCESIHSISQNMLMAENLANQLLVICSWLRCWQISVGFLHDFLHQHWTSCHWRFITTSIFPRKVQQQMSQGSLRQLGFFVWFENPWS